MYTIQQILVAAAIPTELKTSRGVAVRMTPGNQLIETYQKLLRYVAANPEYRGWEVHHIFEALDIARIGAELFSPVYEEQVCVLLPREAHHRINSMLRRENPTGLTATKAELAVGYAGAYAIVGNYCGSSEQIIQRELIAISRAVTSNLIDARNAALLAQVRELRKKLDELVRTIRLYKSLHESLLNLGGVLGVIGEAVNLVNSTARPDLSIWQKPEMFATATLRALSRADTAGAAASVTFLEAYTKKATAQLTAWQDSLPLAGRRTQLLVGAAAFAASIVLIGLEVVALAAADTAVVTTAATGTTEATALATKVRIGVETIVNASTIVEEQAGEEMIEQATKQAYRAILPK